MHPCCIDLFYLALSFTRLHCLDDVAGAVIEIGSNWVKAGYAGEESPKAVIPSWVGSIEASDASATSKSKAIRIGHKDYFVSDVHTSFPRPKMQLESFLKDDTSKWPWRPLLAMSE